MVLGTIFVCGMCCVDNLLVFIFGQPSLVVFAGGPLYSVNPDNATETWFLRGDKQQYFYKKVTDKKDDAVEKRKIGVTDLFWNSKLAAKQQKQQQPAHALCCETLSVVVKLLLVDPINIMLPAIILGSNKTP